jgi:hypothetical protein
VSLRYSQFTARERVREGQEERREATNTTDPESNKNTNLAGAGAADDVFIVLHRAHTAAIDRLF